MSVSRPRGGKLISPRRAGGGKPAAEKQTRGSDVRRLFVVGAGKVGVSLARLFSAGGADVVLLARSPLSREARRALVRSRFRGAVVGSGLHHQQLAGVHLVVLAVPRSALREAALSVLKLGIPTRVPIVHCCGEAPPDAARVGPNPTGSMHPAFSFSGPDVPLNVLRKVCFVLEGDEAAVRECRELLESTKLAWVEGKSIHRGLYHAGCSTAANFLSVLGAASTRMLICAGVNPKDASRLVRSLVMSALENGARGGFAQSVTGPVVRGDTQTVAAHLDAVARSAPDFLPLFIEGLRSLARLHSRSEILDLLSRLGD